MNVEKNVSANKPAPRTSGFVVFMFFVVLFWSMAAAKEFLVPLCISALLSFLVLPIIRFLTKYKVPEWLAISFSTVVLLLPFVVCIYILIHEGQSLAEDFPHIIASVDHWLAGLAQSDLVRRFHLEKVLTLATVSDKLGKSPEAGAAMVISSLGSIVSGVTVVVLVLIFTVLMVASRENLRRSTEKILARFEGIHTSNMLDAVTSLIEQFLIARMVIMFIISVACGITIFLFGVQYAFILGAFIGVLTFLPEIGYLISIIPLIAVAFSTGHSGFSVLSLNIVLFVIHLIEANVLSPKMVGHKLNVNVLASFIGLFGGGILWGIWGMFLSVPILGIVRIILCATPNLAPWGELLAEHEDKALMKKLVLKKGIKFTFLKPQKPAA